MKERKALTGNMAVLQEMVFLSEIVLQVKIAQRTNECLQATHNNFDKVEVWCSIQSILIATGNVSKVLWPNKKYKIRGERLRKMLNVDNTSLLNDRRFRNHFEHYDERIEEWFNEKSPTVYIELSMNPTLRGTFASGDHRGYNSFNNSLIFRGESLDIGAVLMALEEILENCKPYTVSDRPHVDYIKYANEVRGWR